MKAYLLREQPFTAGESIFIECPSPENNYMVVFEDDTDTGYFYAMEGERILDALHIYNIEEVLEEDKEGSIKIIWSQDWKRCALLINDYCHAIFDFENHGGYCRNEFPPPNEIWTKGERTLTDEMFFNLFK
jgi:hypothetical protein